LDFFFFRSAKLISSIYLELSFEQVDAIFYIFFSSILSVIASHSFYCFRSDDTILHFTYSRMSHSLSKFLTEPFALNSVLYIRLNETSIAIHHGSTFLNIGHHIFVLEILLCQRYFNCYQYILNSLVTKCLSVC
jgi:hypothetical protein